MMTGVRHRNETTDVKLEAKRVRLEPLLTDARRELEAANMVHESCQSESSMQRAIDAGSLVAEIELEL